MIISGNGLKEALFYEEMKDRQVICRLCPHECLISDGHRGICQVRENRAGKLYTLVYGNAAVQNVDSIEKKPLFHFYPGSTAYSIATQGCNFHCQYCTNWEISQRPLSESINSPEAAPDQIVASAYKAGCRSIAYTYVEPTIFFEYVYDIASQAHSSGLANVLKTNGYMTNEAVEFISHYLNAANVDLKSFRDATYRYFGGQLNPVLDSLKQLKSLGVWLEVTTVLIPNLNDDPVEIKDMARFIAGELGSETPWHICRFFPIHRMVNTSPTSVEALNRAQDIGLNEGLYHVYLGNLLEPGKQDTLCPNCSSTLIRRRGPNLIANYVRDYCCPYCGQHIAGIGI